MSMMPPNLPTAADMRKKPTGALRMHARGDVTVCDTRNAALASAKAQMRKLAIAELQRRGLKA